MSGNTQLQDSVPGTKPQVEESLPDIGAQARKEYSLIASLSNARQAGLFLSAIEARLQVEPENVGLLLERAQLFRRIADYEAAQKAYARVLQVAGTLQNNADAAAVSAVAYAEVALSILGGRTEAGIDPSASQPCPFVRHRNFLPPAQVGEMLEAAISRQHEFCAAGVDSKNREYRADKRRTLVLFDIDDIRNDFRQFLQQALPECCRQLHMEPFVPGEIEVKMTNHIDGGFFQTHADNDKPLEKSGRAISYLYYFHQRPKRFSGGDLILFDTNLERNSYLAAQFTRITCEHNSLVLFPSGWFHCVEPIALAGNRFEDGRMAIAGHIHY